MHLMQVVLNKKILIPGTRKVPVPGQLVKRIGYNGPSTRQGERNRTDR